MKQFYSVLFSLDNTSKDQNFVIDINEIFDLQKQEKQLTSRLFNHVVFQPDRKVVDKLFEMIRSGEI